MIRCLNNKLKNLNSNPLIDLDLRKNESVYVEAKK